MPGNTFGNLFRLTTFGESHGPAVGGIIDGFPANLPVGIDFIQNELNRRRPGQTLIASPRSENDRIVIVSGIFEGSSTGAPIAFWVLNEDQDPSEYQHLRDVFRPSHADFTYAMKYGIRDYRGGGRSSARETVSRVAGGAFAKLLLASRHVTVRAFTSSIGPVTLEKSYTELSLSETEENPVRCPDQPVAAGMISYLQELMLRSDTTGGTVTCVVQGAPPGWGEPVFDKLQADLAKAMLSIPAAKGFEYGDGFHASTMLGSDHNDIPAVDPKSGKIYMKTNHAGGILGGISNGEDILFRVAFKPVSTLGRPQSTVTSGKETVTVQGPPRYDPCVVPRAVPIVEAMAALVLADHFLRQQSGERIGSQL